MAESVHIHVAGDPYGLRPEDADHQQTSNFGELEVNPAPSESNHLQDARDPWALKPVSTVQAQESDTIELEVVIGVRDPFNFHTADTATVDYEYLPTLVVPDSDHEQVAETINMGSIVVYPGIHEQTSQLITLVYDAPTLVESYLDFPFFEIEANTGATSVLEMSWFEADALFVVDSFIAASLELPWFDGDITIQTDAYISSSMVLPGLLFNGEVTIVSAITGELELSAFELSSEVFPTIEYNAELEIGAISITGSINTGVSVDFILTNNRDTNNWKDF